jgi:hypothetical protein
LGDGVIALDKIRSEGQGAGGQKKRSQTGEQRSFGRASPAQREKDSRDKVGRRSSEKVSVHDLIVSIKTIIAINIRK